MQKPRGKPRGFVLQAKAHGNCIVDLGHRRVIQFSHALTQSGFIDGAYLLKQYDAVTGKSHTLRIELDVGRSLALPVWLVIAAAITVGLCLLPVSF